MFAASRLLYALLSECVCVHECLRCAQVNYCLVELIAILLYNFVAIDGKHVCCERVHGIEIVHSVIYVCCMQM